MDRFTRAYIEAALWSSTLPPYGKCRKCGKENQVLDRWDGYNEHVCFDCGKEPNYEPPADENYDITDIAPETIFRMEGECAKFQAENADDLA